MDQTLGFLRMAITAAKESKAKGNLAFGCVLVDQYGKVLRVGENTIVTTGDCLGHAEINLIRDASVEYSHKYLKKCTIYTSDEPCPMCSSAIFWSGIGKLVYGISKSRYYSIVGKDNADYYFEIPCRDIFERGGRNIEVIGPLLEDEIALLHEQGH